MTGPEIYFYFILPLGLAAAGWVIVFLNEWNDRRKRRLKPGE